MSATDDIKEALQKLRWILDQYKDTGDWYGCVRNAVPFLEESLRSEPPGTGSRKDVQPRYLVEEQITANRLRLAKQMLAKFSDDELVYSASARCPCGAGLAYPKNVGMRGSWDCSAILKGEAKPKGDPESKQHTDELPFMFYEIKSEDQPSAGGATTRPK